MNWKHEQELEAIADAAEAELEEEENPAYLVSPITLWYKFEEDLRTLHSQYSNNWDHEITCNECAELYPCDTIKLLDTYLEDS